MNDAPTPTRQLALSWILAVGAAGAALLWFAPPWVLGDGTLSAWSTAVERGDLRLVLLVLLAPPWLIAVAIALWARSNERPARAVSRLLGTLLNERALPISVNIDQRLPVVFDKPLSVPLELDLRIDLDDVVRINTTIPVHTTIDLDTTVATKVLGLGAIKIPIKATIPVDLSLPVETDVRFRLDQLPIRIREQLTIELPALEAPIKTRLHTKIGF